MAAPGFSFDKRLAPRYCTRGLRRARSDAMTTVIDGSQVVDSFTLVIGQTTREQVRARFGEPMLQELKGRTPAGLRERWVLDRPDSLVVYFAGGVLERIGE